MLHQVKDLEKDMKRVNIILKLIERQEPRYAKGYKIVNYLAADATGTILIPFWNNDGVTVQVGDCIEIQNGYVSEFKGRVQLNIGKFGNFKKVAPPEGFAVNSKVVDLPSSEDDEEVPVSLEQFLYQKATSTATLRLFVQERVEERMVHTKLDGLEHKVATFRVGDASGCILFNIWDDLTGVMEVGQTVTIKRAYLKTYRQRRYLNLAKNGRITPAHGTVKINHVTDFSSEGS